MPEDELVSGAEVATHESLAPRSSLAHYLARVLQTLLPLATSSRPEDRGDFQKIGACLDGIARSEGIVLPTMHVGPSAISMQAATIVALASCAELLETANVLVVEYQVSMDEGMEQGRFYREFMQLLLGLFERHNIARTRPFSDAKGRSKRRFGDWVGNIARKSAFGHALSVSGALPPLD